MRWAPSAALFISSALIFSRVAIWSMKAPVPPAQLPFIRTSVPPVEKEDLGILAAQLDHAVGLGDEPLDRHAGGEHLLHEGHAATLGQAHAGRARNAEQALAPWRYSLSIRRRSSCAFSKIWL